MDSLLAEELQLREALSASLLPPRQPHPLPSSSHASSPSTRHPSEKCSICFARKSPRKMLLLDGCSHKFCSSCVAAHSEAKLKVHQIPCCPHPGCSTPLSPQQSELFLLPELYEKLTMLLAEAEIPEADRVHCPYSDCSELLDRGLLIPSQVEVECLRCHRLFCVVCRVPWHAALSCAEYQQLPLELRETEDAKLHELVARHKWRKCEHCRSVIALSRGCYHMTCRCGYQFCYKCGAKWKTCKCKLWDERNLVREHRHGRR